MNELKLEILALEIRNEIDKKLSVKLISLYLRSIIGELNNLINTSYFIDESGVISPFPTEIDKAILKKLYEIHYYKSKIKSGAYASRFDITQEVNDSGEKVKFINKNEVSKNYNSIIKQASKELKILVNKKLNNQIVDYHLSINQYFAN